MTAYGDRVHIYTYLYRKVIKQKLDYSQYYTMLDMNN